MNELLQQHGCANVFSVPEGLKELMSDISREVLRWQPPNIFDFVAKYLSALLITREHGIMAMKVLEDLCDCKPSVSEHLLQLGLDSEQSKTLADIIKEEVEVTEPSEGKETVSEYAIIKKILNRVPLDEEMTAKVCQVARNAYRDYWYRKKVLQENIKNYEDEPWESAAQHTLEIYKKTKPSMSELNRAAIRIQAAYKGYHVRRQTLQHLARSPKPKRKMELPGPPLDIGGSREIDLGPIINIKPKTDDVISIFEEEASQKLGIGYDPTKTITLVDDNSLEHKRSMTYQPKSIGFETKIFRRDADDQSYHSTVPPSANSSIVGGDQGVPRISFANEPAVVIPYDEVRSQSQGLSGDTEVPEALVTAALEDDDDDEAEVEDNAEPASARSTDDDPEAIEEQF